MVLQFHPLRAASNTSILRHNANVREQEMAKVALENRNFRHPRGKNITISGSSGDDAKRYQIRDVKRAIEMVTDEEA